MAGFLTHFRLGRLLLRDLLGHSPWRESMDAALDPEKIAEIRVHVRRLGKLAVDLGAVCLLESHQNYSIPVISMKYIPELLDRGECCDLYLALVLRSYEDISPGSESRLIYAKVGKLQRDSGYRLERLEIPSLAILEDLLEELAHMLNAYHGEIWLDRDIGSQPPPEIDLSPLLEFAAFRLDLEGEMGSRKMLGELLGEDALDRLENQGYLELESDGISFKITMDGEVSTREGKRVCLMVEDHVPRYAGILAKCLTLLHNPREFLPERSARDSGPDWREGVLRFSLWDFAPSRIEYMRAREALGRMGRREETSFSEHTGLNRRFRQLSLRDWLLDSMDLDT